MNFIYVMVIIFTICSFNYIFYMKRRDTYLKAGKKWDGIVKELSKRK